jgi:CSLREA domain-containing protein
MCFLFRDVSAILASLFLFFSMNRDTIKAVVAGISLFFFVLVGLTTYHKTFVEAANVTIVVNTTDDELNADGDCSFREALQSVNTGVAVDACADPSGLVAGDTATIQLESGQTYTNTIAGADEDSNLTGDFDFTRSDIQYDIVVNGAFGPAIFDFASYGLEDHGFHIKNSVDVSMDNVLLKNFNASSHYAVFSDFGGAFDFSNSQIVSSTLMLNLTGNTGTSTIRNAIFTSSTLRAVGHVLELRPNGTLNVIDSQFTHLNPNQNSSAAIRIPSAQSTISFNNSRFTSNTPTDGFVFRITGGDVTFSSSTIQDNSTIGFGGAINYFATGASNLSILDSLVSGNSTPSDGGAIAMGLGASELAVTNTTFYNNQAGADGGAIYIQGNDPIQTSLHDVLFYENQATNDGGAIFAQAQNIVDISSTTFYLNQAVDGAAILGNNATVTLENDTIVSSNFATGDGGGIAMLGDSSVLRATSTYIGFNQAETGFGGGTYAEGMVSFQDVTVTGNRADFAGGVHIFGANASLNLVESEVTGNQSTDGPAGVYVSDGSLEMNRTLIGLNEVRNNGAGGGVYGQNASSTILNSTIEKNTTQDGQGGGIFWNGGTLSLSNSTIALNKAKVDNGTAAYAGIAMGGNGMLTLDSVTIARNYASTTPTGAGLFMGGTSQAQILNSLIAGNGQDAETLGQCTVTGGSITSLGYNLEQLPNEEAETTCFFSEETDVLTAAVTNDIVAESTTNFGPDGGYLNYLLALVLGSPAMNTGSTTLSVDARGIARPQYLQDDIGAFEYNTLQALSVIGTNVQEGNTGTTTLSFVVSIPEAQSKPVQFTYSTLDGTALGGEDYVAKTNATGSIPAGQTQTTITIDVLGDTAVEADEHLTLIFSSVQSAAYPSPNTPFILNDDAPAPVQQQSSGGGIAPSVLLGNAVRDQASLEQNLFKDTNGELLPILQINDGEKQTSKPLVSLSIDTRAFTRPITHMAVSVNDPDFSGISFVPFVQNMPATLKYAGEQMVYVRLRTAEGEMIDLDASITFLGTTLPALPDLDLGEKDNEEAICALDPLKPYKHKNHPGVWIVTTLCTKRPFVSEATYFSYFDRWDEVTTVHESQLTGIPNDIAGFVPWGPKREFSVGDMVKVTTDPKVYQVTARDPDGFGTLRYIASYDEFVELSNRYVLYDIDEDVLAQYNIQE